jgi:hypothetical protein
MCPRYTNFLIDYLSGIRIEQLYFNAVGTLVIMFITPPIASAIKLRLGPLKSLFYFTPLRDFYSMLIAPAGLPGVHHHSL